MNHHVRVISPGASPQREAVMASAAFLGNAGFHVSLGQHVFDSHRYFAGGLSARLADLIAALQDPAVEIVWCARGGFGTSELLPHLDGIEFDKPIIGYSDNTSLLEFAATRGGSAIHGPVFEELLEPSSSGAVRKIRLGAQLVLDLLGDNANGPGHDFELTSVGPCFGQEFSGRTWGGNLTTLASICGTPWARSFRGALLLLEDVGEAYYRIERLLLQLRQSGALDGVTAVVLGDFHNCPQRGLSVSVADIFVEHLAPMGVPVFFGAPFGHGPCNLPWQFGHEAKIEFDKLSWHGP